MLLHIHIYAISILLTSLNGFTNKSGATELEQINFEISEYNLLFTKVEIKNKKYTALIDFGDFAEFQISTKLINELDLRTEKSDIVMSDINGNQFALEKGTLEQLKVGGTNEENITFYSAKNEIEAVSQQVGTDFQVVIGFGYFKSKNFKLDFISKSIEFLEPTAEDIEFTFPVNTEYGYLIGNFHSNENETVSLLFDTGTPISKIDLDLFPKNLKDANVTFLHTKFPSKYLNVKSSNETITLNMENSNMSELEPLGIVGIYGVNDMKGKVFYYNALEQKVQIKITRN